MKTVVLTTLARVSPWSWRMTFEFCQHPFRLRLDVAGNHLTGLWDNGNLARAKEQVAHAHAVTVRTAGGSGAARFDDALGHKASEFKLWA